MDETGWGLFIKSATSNKRVVALYAVIEALFLLFSTLFSITLAVHFGFDVFNISAILGEWVTVGSTMVAAAVALALGALTCRVAGGWLEASVIARREIWAARRIRSALSRGGADRKTAVRASNHLGRLSAASMKAAAAALVIALNLLILPFALPLLWVGVLVAVILISVALLAFALVHLSWLMRQASIDLVLSSRELAIWKTNPDVEDGEAIDRYSSAYFRRIFLSSIFSYSAWLFALAFSLCILLLSKWSVEVSFGEAFVAFVLAQLYLGLFGQIFNNIIKAAAFAPAIENFAEEFGVSGKQADQEEEKGDDDHPGGGLYRE